jgi:hypothetical protein
MKLLIFNISFFLTLSGVCQSNAEIVYNQNTIDTIISEVNADMPIKSQFSLICQDLIKRDLKDKLERVNNMDYFLLNGNEMSLEYYSENFSDIMGKCQTQNCVIDTFYYKVIPYLKALVHRKFASILTQKADLLKASAKEMPLVSYSFFKNELDLFKFNVTLINNSSKKIKYAWLTLEGLNPVDDVVPISILERNLELKMVGFIESDSKGDYTFDNIFINKTISAVRFKKLKIQLEDGTLKEFNKSSGVVIDDYRIYSDCLTFY